jgi:hypothetical protein
MRKYRVKGCGCESVIEAYSARQAIGRFIRSVTGTRTAESWIIEHGQLEIIITRDVKRNELPNP